MPVVAARVLRKSTSHINPGLFTSISSHAIQYVHQVTVPKLTPPSPRLPIHIRSPISNKSPSCKEVYTQLRDQRHAFAMMKTPASASPSPSQIGLNVQVQVQVELKIRQIPRHRYYHHRWWSWYVDHSHNTRKNVMKMLPAAPGQLSPSSVLSMMMVMMMRTARIIDYYRPTTNSHPWHRHCCRRSPTPGCPAPGGPAPRERHANSWSSSRATVVVLRILVPIRHC